MDNVINVDIFYDISIYIRQTYTTHMKLGTLPKMMIIAIATIVVIIVAICYIPKNQEMLKFKHSTQTQNK
jgi:hypothetical protein